MKKLLLSGLFVVFLFTCVRSVHSDDISYNFLSFGGFVADRKSNFVSDDLNVEFDFVFSRHLFTREYDNFDLGVHFQSDFSHSRNISNNSAYKLTLQQIKSILGIDYTSEVFSTYIGVGVGYSYARFERRSGLQTAPVLPLGSDDIFEPPPSIYGFFASEDSNIEYGNLVQLGFRYRVSEGYEIGASVRQTTADSIGTEFSAFVQRDIGVRLQFPGISFENMSLRLTTTVSDVLRSTGLSLVIWY
ncbi:MAG: hypothetical protein F4Z01_03540 [Gammaproteobacteria bacterium]|nr:hypothetical protein [Gammaproteobacteria bacterium]MYF37676.1 hypothetical protein [Gammaproteobacteria bacterium]